MHLYCMHCFVTYIILYYLKINLNKAKKMHMLQVYNYNFFYITQASKDHYLYNLNSF